jgi:hypothetical protein
LYAVIECATRGCSTNDSPTKQMVFAGKTELFRGKSPKVAAKFGKDRDEGKFPVIYSGEKLLLVLSNVFSIKFYRGIHIREK